MKPRAPLAFSLVELLVALSVTALLAGLLLSAIGTVKRKSWAAQSSSNLRQLVTANLAYAADRGTYVPADDRRNTRRWCAGRGAGGSTFDPAAGFLSPYLGASRRVTACPLFTEMLGGQESFEEGSGGYGYNSSYVGGRPGGAYGADGARVAARPSQIAAPARTVMFTTSALARASGVQEYPFAEPPFWDFGNGPSAYRPTPSVHFRFQGQAIVAWCDGHISMESRRDRPAGSNPYGGDAEARNLGWFGPDEANGYWNSQR